MGQTTFSGPIKAGTIQNTTGTTVGELRNVGSVNVMQTGVVKQTSTSFTTDIVIPANSLITRMYVFRTTVLERRRYYLWYWRALLRAILSLLLTKLAVLLD